MTTQTDAVATFRTEWASRFVDTVTVRRVTDLGTLNATTLQYESGTSPEVFTGDALIRPADTIERNQYGEQLATGVAMAVYVAHDAATFRLEDVVTVDASTLDPDLVGQELTVVAVEFDSYKTRQLLVCRLDEGAGYVE